MTNSIPALAQSRSFTTSEGHRPTIVHKRSLDILHDPWFNKVSLSILVPFRYRFLFDLILCELRCLTSFLLTGVFFVYGVVVK